MSVSQILVEELQKHREVYQEEVLEITNQTGKLAASIYVYCIQLRLFAVFTRRFNMNGPIF